MCVQNLKFVCIRQFDHETAKIKYTKHIFTLADDLSCFGCRYVAAGSRAQGNCPRFVISAPAPAKNSNKHRVLATVIVRCRQQRKQLSPNSIHFIRRKFHRMRSLNKKADQATANMSARCALYMGALKIFHSP